VARRVVAAEVERGETVSVAGKVRIIANPTPLLFHRNGTEDAVAKLL